MGDTVLSKKVYKSCIVKVGDQEMLADLTLLGIQYSDIVLGKDWLSTYYAKVDCYHKKVTFYNSNAQAI